VVHDYFIIWPYIFIKNCLINILFHFSNNFCQRERERETLCFCIRNINRRCIGYGICSLFKDQNLHISFLLYYYTISNYIFCKASVSLTTSCLNKRVSHIHIGEIHAYTLAPGATHLILLLTHTYAHFFPLYCPPCQLQSITSLTQFYLVHKTIILV
jgi:hypothetical protein